MNKFTNLRLYFKATLTICLFMFCASFIQAQNVTGQLLDSDGTPLIGASIIVEGTDRGRSYC